MKNRYEVVRQDNGQRLWYIWDNLKDQAIDDGISETIYYDSFQEAQAECEELNAIEADTVCCVISVELFERDKKQFVHLSHEGSSGAEYAVPNNDLGKVGSLVQTYINTYIR